MSCTHLFSQSLNLIPQFRQQKILFLGQKTSPGFLVELLQAHYLILSEFHDHFIRLNKFFFFEGEVFQLANFFYQRLKKFIIWLNIKNNWASLNFHKTSNKPNFTFNLKGKIRFFQSSLYLLVPVISLGKAPHSESLKYLESPFTNSVSYLLFLFRFLKK